MPRTSHNCVIYQFCLRSGPDDDIIRAVEQVGRGELSAWVREAIRMKIGPITEEEIALTLVNMLRADVRDLTAAVNAMTERLSQMGLGEERAE